MSTTELCAFCFAHGLALPTNHREERAIALMMRETAPAWEFRPPLDEHKRPERSQMDLDCRGNRLKEGT
jgi:hypothetical protein